MIEHSESVANLAAALTAAQAEFGAIPRAHEGTVTGTGKNGPYSYTYFYADLADTIAATRPVLARHGLSVVQLPTSSNTLTTMILHSSGEWLAGEMDLHEASTPQGQGSAISYGRRYAYSGGLCLATEADDDAQLAQSEQRPRQSAARQQSSRPAQRVSGTGITEPQQKALHAIGRQLGLDREALIEACRMVVGRDLESTADLTKSEASQVIQAMQEEARQ